MALNLGLPRLRNRAHYETDKASQAANDAAEQARRAAEQAAEQARIAAEQARQAMADAGQRMGSMELPTIDVRGTIETARKAIGDVRRNLSEGGDQVAQGAQQVGQRAGKVGADLRHTVDDLRSLRITKQPRGRDPWPGVALVAGIVGGIAAMFLFDPQDGKRRRVLVRDKLGKWTRIASETAQGRAKDLRNRSQGLLHETREVINNKMPKQSGESEQAEWPAQEPVGAAASVETRAPSYSDMSHQPGAPNGREV